MNVDERLAVNIGRLLILAEQRGAIIDQQAEEIKYLRGEIERLTPKPAEADPSNAG